MKFYSTQIILLISSIFTPASNAFTDPLLRIRHMIPPSIVSRERMQNNEVHVFEQPNIDKKSTPCLLFFTGGNSLITHEIYSNFLVSLTAKQLSVYTIPFRYSSTDFANLVNELKTEYADISVISHSSGSVPLIDAISQNPEIKKAVLLDPIDSRLDRSKKIRLKYLQSLMMVRAEKSYEGENLAFIPGFLELTADKLKLDTKCIVNELDAEDYGHCDLLNPLYSNLIHKYLRTICDGSENRTHSHLYDYIEWLTSRIAEFVNTPKEETDACEDKPCDLDS